MATPGSLRPIGRMLGLLVWIAGTASGAVTDFSADWRFHRGDVPQAADLAFAAAAWPLVEAPHPARIEALVTDQAERQQWEGICWYRKTFTLPPEAAGRVVRLRFEGAMNRAQIFVNGALRVENIDGFTPFVVDLSDLARELLQPITVACSAMATRSSCSPTAGVLAGGGRTTPA